MTAPPRVLLAKIGLDGHDRGVKVVTRALRDAGLHVIYTGLWRTPVSVARAAMEEDVDVIGVSLLSAAHMTLVPQLLEALGPDRLADVPVIVGGIIPSDDAAHLRQLGVHSVLGPQAPLNTLVEQVRAAAECRRRWPDETRATRFAERDPRALAETLTAIERNAKLSGIVADAKPKPARRGGVTGAPGVGKSTLIGRLVDEMARRGRRVGVLLIDPSSAVTGGALLGDRARLREADANNAVFVRSVPSAGATDGLAPAAGEMLDAMDAFGFDVLLVETVGAGQADTAVRSLAQSLILMFQPGAGDELQLAKAGLTEVADVFVVNKADQPAAEQFAAAVRETCAGDKPVVLTTASRGDGTSALVDLLFGM